MAMSPPQFGMFFLFTFGVVHSMVPELIPFPPHDCHYPMCGAPPPGNCRYNYQYDSRGCPTGCNLVCDGPLCLLRAPCPNTCPNGYKKDAQGCETCQCKPEPLCDPNAAKCLMPCLYGQQITTNSNGCRICRCRPKPRCDPSIAVCSKPCLNGQQITKDSNGCPVCRCRPEGLPCHRLMRCGYRGVCPNSCRCQPYCFGDEFIRRAEP